MNNIDLDSIILCISQTEYYILLLYYEQCKQWKLYEKKSPRIGDNCQLYSACQHPPPHNLVDSLAYKLLCINM